MEHLLAVSKQLYWRYEWVLRCRSRVPFIPAGMTKKCRLGSSRPWVRCASLPFSTWKGYGDKDCASGWWPTGYPAPSVWPCWLCLNSRRRLSSDPLAFSTMASHHSLAACCESGRISEPTETSQDLLLVMNCLSYYSLIPEKFFPAKNTRSLTIFSIIITWYFSLLLWTYCYWLS